MTVQLSMFNLMNLPDSSECISLPASVDGITPSISPDGLDLSGPEAALASPFPSPASEPGSKTLATCGQPGTTSSASAALQLSLANRLRAQPFGSTDYTLTWKTRVLPSRRQICRLQASARSTVGLDSGLLPTPSGTSNHGKNHVAGRLDEWGGSSNPFRGTSLGKVHCPAFELWVMGYLEAWARLMPQGTRSSRRSPRPSSVQP